MLHALLVGTAHAELTHQQAKTCGNNGNHILELAPDANVDDVIAELNAKIASGAPAGRRLASVEGQVFGAKADRPTLVVSIPSASGKLSLSAFGTSKDAEDASNAEAKVLLESVKDVNFAEPDCLAHVQANTDHDEKVCSGSSPITRPWSLQATCCKNCGGTAQGCALDPAGSFDPNNYNTIVFVLDTGVDHHHEAFKEYDANGNYLYSRVIDVWNYIPSTPVQVPLTDPNSDGHSHGTHCAGSVAGNAVGVNHETAIVSQKVLSDSGSGSYSGILKAIEDVAEWMEPGGQYHGKNCVISMSLGGGTSSSISSQPQAPIVAAVKAGCIFTVAAGNSNKLAETSWPAIHGKKYWPGINGLYTPDNVHTGAIVTVGSTASNEARSSFSNYGQVVGIYAPGSNIKSSIPNNRYSNKSGTSMATPLFAGALSMCLHERTVQNPSQSIKDRNRECLQELIVCQPDYKIQEPSNGLPDKQPLLRVYKHAGTCPCSNNPTAPTPAPTTNSTTTFLPTQAPPIPTPAPTADSTTTLLPTQAPPTPTPAPTAAQTPAPTAAQTPAPTLAPTESKEPENICQLTRLRRNLRRLQNQCRSLGGLWQNDLKEDGEFICRADSNGFTYNIPFDRCCLFKCSAHNRWWKCRNHLDKCIWKSRKCQPLDANGDY